MATLKRLLALNLMFIPLVGCVSWFSDDKADQNQSQDDLTDADDTKKDSKKDEETMPHPKAPNAWNTKMLVITNPMPGEQQLTTCRNQMEALAKSAVNPDSLRVAEKQATNAVEQNQVLYHWCFYQTMNLLDEALSNFQMETSYQNRLNLFLLRMKTLWILGRALDTASNSQAYFNYIQARYVEISQEIFARDVDVLGQPLGGLNKIYSKPNDTPKPAAAAEVDL